MTTNLENASECLHQWQHRLGEILTKPERQLINQFVMDAKNSEDPSLLMTPELKAAIKKAKADEQAKTLLRQAMKYFTLADIDEDKNKLYPTKSLNSFRRKAYSMLCGGE